MWGLSSSTIRGNLFGLEYRLFLNDLYSFGSVDLLNYYMVKQYLETIDMVINSGSLVGFRFNKRQDRLYEYQKILNDVQKMFDLPFFEPHNLSKNVDDEGQFNEFIDTSFVDDVDEDNSSKIDHTVVGLLRLDSATHNLHCA